MDRLVVGLPEIILFVDHNSFDGRKKGAAAVAKQRRKYGIDGL